MGTHNGQKGTIQMDRVAELGGLGSGERANLGISRVLYAAQQTLERRMSQPLDVRRKASVLQSEAKRV